MRWIRLIVLGLLAAIAANLYPDRLQDAGLAPFWLLLPALLYGLRCPAGSAALAGWCFGLAADLLSIEPFGFHAFLFGTAAATLAVVRQGLFTDHPVTQGIVGFAMTLAVLLAALVRLEAAHPELELAARLPAALLLALVTGAVLPLLVGLDRLVGFTTGFRERGRRVRA